jgi:hypothetical protein
MVNTLVFVQTFIEVGLAGGTSPQHVPFVAFSVIEAVSLHDTADQLGITSQNFVE